MAVALIATLALSQYGNATRKAWEALTPQLAAEAQHRRPDLKPFRSDVYVEPGQDRFDSLQRAHQSWYAGRQKEAIGVLRLEADRKGGQSQAVIGTLGRMLAFSGQLAEARDLVGVNLRYDMNSSDPFLYAVLSVETGVPHPKLDGHLRLWMEDHWRPTPGELDRLYPRDAAGLRRLAWAAYASGAVHAHPRSLTSWK